MIAPTVFLVLLNIAVGTAVVAVAVVAVLVVVADIVVVSVVVASCLTFLLVVQIKLSTEEVTWPLSI